MLAFRPVLLQISKYCALQRYTHVTTSTKKFDESEHGD